MLPVHSTSCQPLIPGKLSASSKSTRANGGSPPVPGRDQRPLVTDKASLRPNAPNPAKTLGRRKTGKYALRSQVAGLTGQISVGMCLTRPIFGGTASSGYFKSIKHSGDFRGLMPCGNVNICPTCAEQRAKHNIQLVTWALSQGKQRGYIPLLVTATLRHSRSETLQCLLDDLSRTWAKTHDRRAWRELKKIIGYLGSITAIETTWGKANGWHPHIHAILLVKDQGKAGNARISALLTEYYRSQWRRESQILGRPLPSEEHGITVVHGDLAGAYIAKMGLSSELTSAVTKIGRQGRYTPWQLLCESMPNSPETKVYADKFREYAYAFRGRITLRWTPGLREALGVEDEEQMPKLQDDNEHEWVELYRYSAMEMRAIIARDAHQRILDVINNVQDATNSNTELIKEALSYEVALIVHEYTSGFRARAGLRPPIFESGPRPKISGYAR